MKNKIKFEKINNVIIFIARAKNINDNKSRETSFSEYNQYLKNYRKNK